MREYEEGESLRKVHWPSTARRGQLMVKDPEGAGYPEGLNKDGSHDLTKVPRF